MTLGKSSTLLKRYKQRNTMYCYYYFIQIKKKLFFINQIPIFFVYIKQYLLQYEWSIKKYIKQYKWFIKKYIRQYEWFIKKYIRQYEWFIKSKKTNKVMI